MGGCCGLSKSPDYFETSSTIMKSEEKLCQDNQRNNKLKLTSDIEMVQTNEDKAPKQNPILSKEFKDKTEDLEALSKSELLQVYIREAEGSRNKRNQLPSNVFIYRSKEDSSPYKPIINAKTNVDECTLNLTCIKSLESNRQSDWLSSRKS